MRHLLRLRGCQGSYVLDDDTVLKTATESMSVQDLEAERRIYERLGRHPRILRCFLAESCGFLHGRDVLQAEIGCRNYSLTGETILMLQECLIPDAPLEQAYLSY